MTGTLRKGRMGDVLSSSTRPKLPCSSVLPQIRGSHDPCITVESRRAMQATRAGLQLCLTFFFLIFYKRNEFVY